jgi:hypothetical protein
MQSIRPWGIIFRFLCHFKISTPLNIGIDPRTKGDNKKISLEEVGKVIHSHI